MECSGSLPYYGGGGEEKDIYGQIVVNTCTKQGQPIVETCNQEQEKLPVAN